MTRVERLLDALEPPPGFVTAFVGAGGKTSAMLLLAAELREAGSRVLVTTTTRVGRSVASRLPLVLSRGADGHTQGDALAGTLERTLDDCRWVFLAGGTDVDGKFTGVTPERLRSLTESLTADFVLVEADGSRQRPLKAPAEHEPVMPVDARLVVPVAGLDALGQAVGPDAVHRPELIPAVCGPPPGGAAGHRRTAPRAATAGDRIGGTGDRVTPELVAALLASPDGGLKSVPPDAAVVPLLNKLSRSSEDLALETARLLLDGAAGRVRRVVLSDVLEGRFGYVETRRGR
jgi:molybdenum cofactor cytidylyltransferase